MFTARLERKRAAGDADICPSTKAKFIRLRRRGEALMEVDEEAKRDAVTRYGLPPSLHLPIAAVNEDAIRRFIGKTAVLRPGAPNKALLVELGEVPEVDAKLRVWTLARSAVLHQKVQVWVHVDYPGYRGAYASGFPDEPLAGLVLDHVMNRRMARLAGFQYVRLVPITRQANSSSGSVSEAYGVEYQRSLAKDRDRWKNRFIQYADLADIVKMLDIKTGGTLLEGVNEGHRLLEES